MLFFAIQEGKVAGVDSLVKDWGWDLSSKDETMTFRHLANMVSGYARGENPGEAYAYNDYGIELYAKTLYEKVFAGEGDMNEVTLAGTRLGALHFEDGTILSGNYRVDTSVRDFARIGWFWLNRGSWGSTQVLARSFFDNYMKPDVQGDMPRTSESGTDYLRIGSYGGGSDQDFPGQGIYGFNWWYNAQVGTSTNLTWPDAPADTIVALGYGGRNMAVIPSLDIVIAAQGNWGSFVPGDAGAGMNRTLKRLREAVVEDGPTVSGNLREWQTVTVSFKGPTASETDDAPNPFLDYRLQVTFAGPSAQTYDVPGFFDGDGEGGATGDVWRVRFVPDEDGTWQYSASFRSGTNVAVDLGEDAGTPVGFDGAGGSFTVSARDPDAPGFLRWGRLEYAGGHYLKFAEGPYWLKGGTDSPENLLGYVGFHGTPNGTHSYSNHVADWTESDPDWENGKGKGIIGALNYLASNHVNSVYLMLMNIGGDGQDVWPFVGPIDPGGSGSNDNLHYDISKLRQWETVFAHAQTRSVYLHFVLSEAEAANKNELDDATLGTERKLYYREMIARFGHHPALQWNVCEEYNLKLDLGVSRVMEFAGYIQDVDPYDHPISVHHAGSVDSAWSGFVGDSRFSVTSFQTRDIEAVERFRSSSEVAGRPLVIGMDEFYPDFASAANADDHRKTYTWPVYLSGGQLEYILSGLLNTEDFSAYEPNWRYTWYARRFVEEHLPFWEMTPYDDLLTGESGGLGHVFVKPGSIYAVYLPVASQTGTLDLDGAPGSYRKRWYNPRSGVFEGTETTVSGGGALELGTPPADADQDWVLLLTADDSVATYPLTVHQGSGDGEHVEGAIVEIQADPPPTGKVFDQWTGDVSVVADARAATTTITMPPTNVVVTATYENAPGGQSVVDFTLIDADTDLPIGGFDPLFDGATLNLTALPTRNLNVRANTFPATVGSVRFGLDGNPNFKTENASPYAMAGDSGGDYGAWTPGVGSHVLAATPYTGGSGGGTAGTPLSISFDVIEGDPGDFDGDGMPDDWEIHYFRSSSHPEGGAASDWDKDGMSNLHEYQAGTDPTDPASLLAATGLASLAGAGVVLSWHSASNRMYSIRRSTNLLMGFEQVVAAGIPSSPPINTYTVALNRTTPSFYRIEVD